MRVLIYTGKGGVGKTSIAAATAVHIAREGKKVLIMSTDQAHSLADSFDIKIGEEETEIEKNLFALQIDSVSESARAWGNLQDYLKQIISDKANGGITADEVLFFPGLEELFSLLKILDVCESGFYDTIVVDCAPTGETLALLKYPERLEVLAAKLLPPVRSMNTAFGGLISRRTQVPKPRDQVFEEFDRLVKRLSSLQKILKDRQCTSMRIVMTPEKIVFDEARRNYTWLNEYDFGIDAVYINKIYPKEAMQGYFGGWNDIQKKSIMLAEQSFGECKVFKVMLQEEEIRGLQALGSVAELLYEKDDPESVFCLEPSFRMEDIKGTRNLIIRLPYASGREIKVSREGDDMILTLRNQTRRFGLPDKLRRRKITDWTYKDGELRVLFDYD